MGLLGFKLKDNPKDSVEGLIPLNTKIQTDFSTTVISKMLPVIYNRCVKRTKNMVIKEHALAVRIVVQKVLIVCLTYNLEFGFRRITLIN